MNDEMPYLKACFSSSAIDTQGCWYYEIANNEIRKKVFSLEDGVYSVDDLELMAVLHALENRTRPCEIELYLNNPFNHMIITQLQKGEKVNNKSSVIDLNDLKKSLGIHIVHPLMAN